MVFSGEKEKVELRQGQLLLALRAAAEAGRKIMDIYRTDFNVAYKDDKSPVTDADRRANEAIEKLLPVSGLPILSEEGKDIPFEKRRRWKMFWLVDPLDGTKEFISRNGEFTVNIALIVNAVPELGVVFAPAKDVAYFGIAGQGAYRLDDAFSFFLRAGFMAGSETGSRAKTAKGHLADEPVKESAVERWPDHGLWKLLLASAVKLPLVPEGPGRYTVVGSRSHGGSELEKYIETLRAEHGEVVFRPAGSSLKICLVAEGSAHQYPRLGTTMEWDTAAGHAVALASGAGVCVFGRDTALAYNKSDLRNPWFMVERKREGN